MDAQDVLNVVVIGSIYTLFALGLTLSWGVLNILNLAHGATFMFGGLLAYLVTKDTALSLWLVLPISAIACGLIAVVLELVAYRPIRNRVADLHAAELATMIASIGAAAVLVALAEVITENQLVGINPESFNVTRTEIFGVGITNLEIVIVVMALILSAVLVYFVTRTRHGRALRALAQDPYTCGLMGISQNALAAATMFVSGALAGVAGVLLAMQLNTVEARLGEPLLLKAFAVIILGGVGSVQGAIAAAFLLALAETFTDVYIGDQRPRRGRLRPDHPAPALPSAGPVLPRRLAACLMEWFSDNETLIQAALAGAILAYSFQIAMRAGVFTLAGVGFWAIGGYTTAYLVTEREWMTAPAIGVGVLISGVIGLLLALVLGRLRSLYLAMATVAFVLLIQIVAINWEAVTGGAGGMFGIPVTVSTWQLLVIVAVISVGAVLLRARRSWPHDRGACASTSRWR